MVPGAATSLSRLTMSNTPEGTSGACLRLGIRLCESTESSGFVFSRSSSIHAISFSRGALSVGSSRTACAHWRASVEVKRGSTSNPSAAYCRPDSSSKIPSSWRRFIASSGLYETSSARERMAGNVNSAISEDAAAAASSACSFFGDS